jgi:hypothetical protein
LSELEKGVAEKDEAVRQFKEEASAFTEKVENLTKTLASREADYQVHTHESCKIVLCRLPPICPLLIWNEHSYSWQGVHQYFLPSEYLISAELNIRPDTHGLMD